MSPKIKGLMTAGLIFSAAVFLILGIATLWQVAQSPIYVGNLLLVIGFEAFLVVSCLVLGLSLSFSHGVDKGKRKGLGQPIPFRDLPADGVYVPLEKFQGRNEDGHKDKADWIILVRDNHGRHLLITIEHETVLPKTLAVRGDDLIDFISMEIVPTFSGNRST